MGKSGQIDPFRFLGENLRVFKKVANMRGMSSAGRKSPPSLGLLSSCYRESCRMKESDGRRDTTQPGLWMKLILQQRLVKPGH